MRETRSRTSSGPSRFMGGAAISANSTAPSLRTLSVSKTMEGSLAAALAVDNGKRPDAVVTAAAVRNLAMNFIMVSCHTSCCPPSKNGFEELIRCHHLSGVVRDVDVQGGVHVILGVARGRVLHHGHVVAQLGGEAHGGLDAGVSDQPDDDELVYAVLLELQIEVGIGEGAGAPMLLDDDLARSRHEVAAELAAPGAVCEHLALPACLLDRGDVLPGLIVAGTIPAMRRVEHAQPGLPGRIEDPQHVGNAAVRFRDRLQAIPDLAA